MQEILAHPDEPKPSVLIRKRIFQVSGWAVSAAGVASVEVFLDGELRGPIEYGWSRPDIAVAYPRFPAVKHCGYMGELSARELKAGSHEVMIRVRAKDGAQRDISTEFRVDPTWMEVGEVPDCNADYQKCLLKNTPDRGVIAAARAEVARFVNQPRISLILLVSAPSDAMLQATVDSVRSLIYDQWELCLVLDPRCSDSVRRLAIRLADSDARIVIACPEHQEHQEHASLVNAALERLAGEFLGRLECGDILSPFALLEMARVLRNAPHADLIYSDEDKVDEKGSTRWDPFFKPDWSPELLCSMNYIGQFSLYRRSLFEEVGGFRGPFEKCADYDLVLRLTERTTWIRHIPRILYSRMRPLDDPEIRQPNENVRDAEKRALEEALGRRRLLGDVEPNAEHPRAWRVRYSLLEHPQITIVLPTAGKHQYVRTCLESILNSTTYPNYQLLVIDNSETHDVRNLCRELQSPKLRREEIVLQPFNYSALMNRAVSLVTSPYVVFLNDDMSIITPDWLESMLEHAQNSQVGLVGAKLLYANGCLQHAGVVIGLNAMAGHAFKHLRATEHGYFGLHQVVRNYSAVTFACAMMRRSLVLEVGGLDAENLAIAYNDVDI